MTAPAKIDEPTNLREAFARAKADLNKPTLEAHLRWVFWHARAVARCEVARLAREKLVHHERDVQMVMLSQFSPSLRDAIAEQLPADATLRTADEMLIETASMVEATRRIVDLLAGELALKSSANSGRR